MSFAGVHCVLYALFDKSGALDRGAMRAQVEAVLAAGVAGVTVLGLATEVGKLSEGECRDVVDWAAGDIGARVPLSVTIAGNSVAEQRRRIDHAAAAGAAFVILQPPLAGNYGAQVYLDFFTEAAAGCPVPVAIQNAPQLLGRALSPEDVTRLRERIPGLALVKAESSAVDFAALVARCGPGLTYLAGRGGLEMTDCLAHGASGFVLAPDAVDHAVRSFALWQAGDRAGAEAAYGHALPALVFMMQSVEHLICYGKRVFGHRTGIDIHDRAPALAPVPAGLAMARRWADHLGRFGA